MIEDIHLTHVSDLHGRDELLVAPAWRTDAFVFTGDILDELRQPDIDAEARYQRNWFRHKAARFRAFVGDAPVLVVDGNHDWFPLGQLMREEGIRAIDVTPAGAELLGLRFAGYPHMPEKAGRWNREVDDQELARLTRLTFDEGRPDVLVTHVGPAGVLSDVWGNGPLADRLARAPGRVRASLFGHAHEHGGATEERWGVRFHNGALGVQLVLVPRVPAGGALSTV